MIMSSSSLRLHTPATVSRRQRFRFKRFLEGVSLWLSVLLMLFVHPLYAEASEADNVGQLHFVNGQEDEARVTARSTETPMVPDNLPTLLPAGSQAGMLRYPQTATPAPLLIALGLVGLMLCLALVLLQKRVFA